MGYKVITDEEYFNKYKTLQGEIRMLSSLFQNQGVVVSEEEKKEFEQHVQDFKKSFTKVIQDGLARLEEIK